MPTVLNLTHTELSIQALATKLAYEVNLVSVPNTILY